MAMDLSQAEHSESEDEEGQVLTDGDHTSATDADDRCWRPARVSFLSDRDQDHPDDVRRWLIEKANTIEVAEAGRLGWQADGTPSNVAAPGEGEQDIRAAVQQLAQRYNGPREFWTESTLPTLTKDSLPSAWATRDQLPAMTMDSLPSNFATREQLPVLTRDSLPSNFATREQLPALTRGAGDDAHPSSPSSDDGKGFSSLESAQSESDHTAHSSLQTRKLRSRSQRLLSQETLPTIISESCENSEIGSLCAGSRAGSSMGSRPVSRCHTRDSLAPIGDVSESEDSSVEGSASREDQGSSSTRAHNESSEGDTELRSPVDMQEALRLAYEQISALRKQEDSIRQRNASLSYENAALKKLAASGSLLRSLADGANNPKHYQMDQSCLESCRTGENLLPWHHRRRSDPGPQAEEKLRRVTLPPEPPEQDEPEHEEPGQGSAESGRCASTMASKELWLKRRQERRERRMSGTDGKISYRRWLQEQHEQAPVTRDEGPTGCPTIPERQTTL